MSKQHCRKLQIERFFRQSRTLLRHCCRFWQQCCRFRQQRRTKFCPIDKVEANWTCSIYFNFVERAKLYDKLVRHCCRSWQQNWMSYRQSRTLLRLCCWCGLNLNRTANLLLRRLEISFLLTYLLTYLYVLRVRRSGTAVSIPRRLSFHLQQQQWRRVSYTYVIRDVMRRRSAPALAFPALRRRRLHIRARLSESLLFN